MLFSLFAVCRKSPGQCQNFPVPPEYRNAEYSDILPLHFSSFHLQFPALRKVHEVLPFFPVAEILPGLPLSAAPLPPDKTASFSSAAGFLLPAAPFLSAFPSAGSVPLPAFSELFRTSGSYTGSPDPAAPWPLEHFGFPLYSQVSSGIL